MVEQFTTKGFLYVEMVFDVLCRERNVGSGILRTPFVKEDFGPLLIRGIVLVVRAEPLFPTNSWDWFWGMIFSASRILHYARWL
jgi:hypothetical protein